MPAKTTHNLIESEYRACLDRFTAWQTRAQANAKVGRKNATPMTAQGYTHRVSRFLRWAGTLNPTHEQTRAYHDFQLLEAVNKRGKPMSASSGRQNAYALRSWFTFRNNSLPEDTLTIGVVLAYLQYRKKQGKRNSTRQTAAEASGTVFNTGTLQQVQGNDNTIIGTFNVTPASPEKQPSNEVELRQKARQLLYSPGRLAEAVAAARELAERQGKKSEAEWLTWELKGLRPNAPEATTRAFRKRAPYRSIKTEIPEYEPQARMPKPPSHAWTVFWSRPIEEVEAAIQRLEQNPNQAFVISTAKDELFDPASEIYGRIVSERVPVMIDLHRFVEIRMGLRDTLESFLST